MFGQPSFKKTRFALLGTLIMTWTHLSTGNCFADEPVRTSAGWIIGESSDGLRHYKGIPFAAPPVGELRWRPPQPVQAWEGVRDCTEYGPVCPQQDFFMPSPDDMNCRFLTSDQTDLRYSPISSAALAPSPAAEATCLVERARTSPAAKMPGTLVSNKAGSRSS